MQAFAKGKRSIIYKEGETIIKVKHPDSQAVNRMANEAKWLQILNKQGIGPTFQKIEENKVYMEYIEGTPLLQYIVEANKKEKIKLLKDLLQQCRTLDLLGVNKYEMHRPFRNAIIRKKKVILIDFERCRHTEKPKNVTQVCQFIARNFSCPQVLGKAKAYKETLSDEDFEAILACVTNIS